MTVSTGRVFILEPLQRSLDTQSSQRFGELVHLFQRGDERGSVFKPCAFMIDVVEALRDKRFDPEVDSFMLVPPLLNCAIALLAVSAYCDDKPFHVLMYNAPFSAYERVPVDMCKLDEMMADGSGGLAS